MKIAKSLTTSTSIALESDELQDLLRRAVKNLLPSHLTAGVNEKDIELNFVNGTLDCDGVIISFQRTEPVSE